MANVEIDRIRALLAAAPRATELGERRKRLYMLGHLSPVPPDVRTLAVRARTLALDYRPAPEYPYPTALQDAFAGYCFLLWTDIDPKDIIVGGDSAGGGLTFALMLSLRDAHLPLPGRAWCISPWADLAMTGPSLGYLILLATASLDGTNERAPLVSPLYADLHGLPPIFIQVGSAETLLDDSVRLARALGEADVPVTLEVYRDMVHVWPLFFGSVAAGRNALAAAGRFMHGAE